MKSDTETANKYDKKFTMKVNKHKHSDDVNL